MNIREYFGMRDPNNEAAPDPVTPDSKIMLDALLKQMESDFSALIQKMDAPTATISGEDAKRYERIEELYSGFAIKAESVDSKSNSEALNIIREATKLNEEIVSFSSSFPEPNPDFPSPSREI